MKKAILHALMAGMLAIGAGGAWAQDAPAPLDTPAAPATTAPATTAPAVEQPVNIPAPDLNVNVAPPPAAPPRIDVQVDAPAPAPPSTVIIEKGEPSTSTTTNITKTETTVVQPPAEGAFNPWLAVGIGLAVLIVVLFVAMAFTDRRDHTVTTGRGTTVTTVR